MVSGAKVLADAGMQADLSVAIALFRKPDAALFKGKRKITLSACVCTQCGYIELYADSPDTLKVAATA